MVVSEAMRMAPASGSSRPASIRRSVVLPAPFGSAEADAFAIGDLPRDVVEQDAVAERFGEVGELDHVNELEGAKG